jgi:hypothetical protein
MRSKVKELHKFACILEFSIYEPATDEVTGGCLRLRRVFEADGPIEGNIGVSCNAATCMAHAV